MLTTDIKRVEPERILLETDLEKKTAMMQYLAQECRVDVMDIRHDKGTGHWGGAASAAELLVALYFHVLDVKPDEPRWPDRDRLVISKGHASCMIYTVLAKRGYFPVAELNTFRQLNSRLQGHPCMNKVPGVEMSTGALGHGMSVTLGMALAARVQNKKYWSYVLIGDGDLNEGETWEGIMSAAKFKPERFVALVDYNKVQLDGPSEEIMPLDPLPEKFTAFGWNVAPKIFNGHQVSDIIESMDWIQQQDQWPVVVIYNTHKGRGVSFMEDNYKWHGAPVDDGAYVKSRPELLDTLSELKVPL